MSQNRLPSVVLHIHPQNKQSIKTLASKHRYQKSLINKKYDWIGHHFAPQLPSVSDFIKINLNSHMTLIKKRCRDDILKESQVESPGVNYNKQSKRVFILNHKLNLTQNTNNDLKTCKSLLNTKIKDHHKLSALNYSKKYTRQNNEFRKHFCSLQQIQYSNSHTESIKGKPLQQFQLKPWKHLDESRDKQNFQILT